MSAHLSQRTKSGTAKQSVKLLPSFRPVSISNYTSTGNQWRLVQTHYRCLRDPDISAPSTHSDSGTETATLSAHRNLSARRLQSSKLHVETPRKACTNTEQTGEDHGGVCRLHYCHVNTQDAPTLGSRLLLPRSQFRTYNLFNSRCKEWCAIESYVHSCEAAKSSCKESSEKF